MGGGTGGRRQCECVVLHAQPHLKRFKQHGCHALVGRCKALGYAQRL
jgi:hypothetical protein